MFNSWSLLTNHLADLAIFIPFSVVTKYLLSPHVQVLWIVIVVVETFFNVISNLQETSFRILNLVLLSYRIIRVLKRLQRFPFSTHFFLALNTTWHNTSTGLTAKHARIITNRNFRKSYFSRYFHTKNTNLPYEMQPHLTLFRRRICQIDCLH